jgi:uncharacterized membrane protein YeiB
MLRCHSSERNGIRRHCKARLIVMVAVQGRRQPTAGMRVSCMLAIAICWQWHLSAVMCEVLALCPRTRIEASSNRYATSWLTAYNECAMCSHSSQSLQLQQSRLRQVSACDSWRSFGVVHRRRCNSTKPMYAHTPFAAATAAQMATKWEIINIVFQIGVDIAIWQAWGWGAVVYMFMCTFFAFGAHPCAAHFIQEHYTIKRGPHNQAGDPQVSSPAKAFDKYEQC